MLAIETSCLRGSVALGQAGQAVAWRALEADRKHAAELVPAIQELLADASHGPRDVGVVCFSKGPGSFTGLRVAATVTRLWQSVVECLVVAAPSLKVIAQNALDHPDQPERVTVILDARRGQVYCGLFERNGRGLKSVVEAHLHEVHEWLRRVGKPCLVLGDGALMYREEVEAAGLTVADERYWQPDARQTLVVGWQQVEAGRFCRPEEIVPSYLRPPECEEVFEQRRAEARKRRGE